MGSTPISSWNLTSRKVANDEALPLRTGNHYPLHQAEATAEVYTHDSRLLEKLRRLAEKYPDQIVKKDRQTFLVPKRCVSVREPYSAERRKAASERAKAAGYRPPTPKKGNE